MAKLARASEAITTLDLKRAQSALAEIDSEGPAVSFERARLALYRGDCFTAKAILSAPAFEGKREPEQMLRLSQRCAGALSDSAEFQDEKLGVLLRFQDSEDTVLAPFIVGVAAKARDAMKHELGVDLPRPLRVDIVRDNFSLAAVTGLPLQAAETTGTVAVARWGRVMMISPAAAPHGYPWQDTLAHEVVHLALTRATADHAPLWLQEGLAKRTEKAWREKRPFDDQPDATQVAARALLSGDSVGIDKLGASIAMLPSPRMAAIAYAEVESFVEYWIGQNGQAALELLLRDIRGLGRGGFEGAIKSITGYGLQTWVARWQEQLQRMPTRPPRKDSVRPRSSHEQHHIARLIRLGELLANANESAAAVLNFEKADSEIPAHPLIRWHLARNLVSIGERASAHERLGALEELPGLHAGWLALRGQLTGDPTLRQQDYNIAVGLHPYLEDVACRRTESHTKGGAEERLQQSSDSAAATRPMGSPPNMGFFDVPEDDLAPSDSDTWRKLCEKAGRALHN